MRIRVRDVATPVGLGPPAAATTANDFGNPVNTLSRKETAVSPAKLPKVRKGEKKLRKVLAVRKILLTFAA